MSTYVGEEWRRLAPNLTVFSRVSINDPIPPDRLGLKFPEGLPVTDKIENKQYRVDSNEKPIAGSEADFLVSKDEQLRLEALRPWYVRHRVLLWAAALLVAAAGVLVVRRAKAG
jgi:hypothetical protein